MRRPSAKPYPRLGSLQQPLYLSAFSLSPPPPPPSRFSSSHCTCCCCGLPGFNHPSSPFVSLTPRCRNVPRKSGNVPSEGPNAKAVDVLGEMATLLRGKGADMAALLSSSLPLSLPPDVAYAMNPLSPLHPSSSLPS